MASNETVLVENAVSKLYNLQFLSIGISTFLNEHCQLQFHYFEAIEINAQCIFVLIFFLRIFFWSNIVENWKQNRSEV